MWEMIERMATDRLWIYTALAGSLFGAAFLFWFKDTKIATGEPLVVAHFSQPIPMDNEVPLIFEISVDF